jgi:hypothetical protein
MEESPRSSRASSRPIPLGQVEHKSLANVKAKLGDKVQEKLVRLVACVDLLCFF